MLNRTLFFIRAYNDLDHFTPVIAEFVKKGENPIIVNYGGLNISGDYRAKYLCKLGAIDIINMPDKKFISAEKGGNFWKKILLSLYRRRRKRRSLLGQLYRKLFFDFSNEVDFLVKYNVANCVFEWGTPFIRGDLVERFFIAAKSKGLKTVAIPHGCNVFLNSDVTDGYRKNFGKGVLPDNTDRNLYDYYVLQNPLRRDGWIKWGYDPVKTQAWGSPRFTPQWARINAGLVGGYSLDVNTKDKLKVVFMHFQRGYNVNRRAIKETLISLSSNPEVSLVVKDSTRAKKDCFSKSHLIRELGSSLIDWCGNETHSPALIKWSDCVIVFGSSIGVEVLLQNRLLINPLFLHSNTTLYEYFGVSHDVSSIDELSHLITRIKSGSVKNNQQAIKSFFREIVYAGRDPYDVADYYFNMISNSYLTYN